MIKKIKHPSNRGERLAVKAEKKIHSNASPVFKLLEKHKWLYPVSLKEKEALDADSKLANERDDRFAVNRDSRKLHP